ncbi:hypothetical protein [Streptomyces sp. NPDC050759]|uniref:hypothetical protein n=1 Tax=Streptomyces sp. NPDC050759 TaxID=3365635 RepID=UPI0037A9A4AC
MIRLPGQAGISEGWSSAFMTNAVGGIMSGMDQGDAAVLAAGLGIAGTLAAGLMSPLLQAHTARRQSREQEAIDIRHRLREERRVAFAAVLDQGETVQRALSDFFGSRESEEHTSRAVTQSEWAHVTETLHALRRAATEVAVTGPGHMADLAETIHAEALRLSVATRRVLEAGDDPRAVPVMADTGTRLANARGEFVSAAQKAMAPPE